MIDVDVTITGTSYTFGSESNFDGLIRETSSTRDGYYTVTKAYDALSRIIGIHDPANGNPVKNAFESSPIGTAQLKPNPWMAKEVIR